jgi:uncharacterized protein (DUF302 family)
VIETDYGLQVRLEVPYERAVEKARAAMAEQGFGVLTEIDVRATLQQKIGADFRPYVILGTCHPELAHRALQSELELGLLLPCNVIVYQDGDGSVVSVIDPYAMLEVTSNRELEPVAREARARLEAALEALG